MSGSATNDDDREQLPAVVTDQPAQAPETASTQQLPEDPDDRAVAEARAEVARQDQEERQAAQPPADQAQQPASQPAQGQPPASGMVPAGLLGNAYRRAKALEDENLYLKGALAVQRQQAQPGTTTQQPAQAQQQPSIQDQVIAQSDLIMEASKKFDEGEITMVQFKTIEMAANDQIAALRANHLIDHVRNTMPAAQTVGIADAVVLDRHLEAMAQQHPWSVALNDRELNVLSVFAREEFIGLGRPINPGNPADTLRLRTRVAELADFYGPSWYPNKKVQAPAAAQQPQPQTGNQPNNGQQRAARAFEGARLAGVAARQPPSISTAGFADTGHAAITDDRILEMTEDEIMALPRATKDRFLNGR